jgi:hypothetical protein
VFQSAPFGAAEFSLAEDFMLNRPVKITKFDWCAIVVALTAGIVILLLNGDMFVAIVVFGIVELFANLFKLLEHEDSGLS